MLMTTPTRMWTETNCICIFVSISIFVYSINFGVRCRDVCPILPLLYGGSLIGQYNCSLRRARRSRPRAQRPRCKKARLRFTAFIKYSELNF